jgi:23S rRNA (adenine2030-N6)-methyltransferase
VTELTVAARDESDGMYGSGMAIVNAPWQTDQALAALLPAVADLLAPGRGAIQLRWLTGNAG